MKTIINRLVKFRQARAWEQYHTPKNLVMAVAGESGELVDLYLWDREPKLMNVAWEVADVFIYLLNLCDVLGLDPQVIINQKIDQNELNYPALESFGKDDKCKSKGGANEADSGHRRSPACHAGKSGAGNHDAGDQGEDQG